MRFHTAALFESEYEPPSLCHFGILEVGLPALLAGGLEAAGVGAATAGVAGGIGAGALEGAALGSGFSALTGGDPGKGALTGAISGGAIGAAGPVAGVLGIGTTAASVGLGAGGGLLGAELTGQDPLKGALIGGAGGAASGLLSGSSAPTPTVTSGTSGGTSAAAQAGAGAPTPVGGANPVDLTAPPSSTLGLAGGDPFAFDTTSTSFTNPAAATTQGGAAPASTGTLGGIGSKIMGLAEKNPGIVLGGGLLAANMLMGDKPLPAEAAIQQQAGEAQTQARTLTAYQTSGTLPPGLEAVVDQQFNSAKAAVVDQFAKEGLGNSTMMADKLNQLRVQKSTEIAQFADSLAKQGIQWENLSAQEFGTLLNAQATQDAAFTAALGSFAGGLAGLRTTTAKT